MKIMSFLIALVLLTNSFVAQDIKSIKTIAELSNYESTSTYNDVIHFISILKKQSNLVQIENIATTVEGHEIPLVIIADPMPKDLNKIKLDPRIKVYIQGNIHAGEVEGKEALLMFARDILNGNKELLKDVILLLCPIFNADGNEPISPKNRTNQNGPKNGVGIRYNGQNLDLNRDAMKLESPEVQGLVKNVLNKYDPAVFLDCHTTNGSYHEEPVTFVWQMNCNGDTSLISYMRDKMMPDVSSTLSKKYNTLNCFYGEFIDQRDYSKGWISYAFEPRYIVNYVGLRNRLAILNENYVYADFKSRVIGCYNLLWSVVEYSAQNKKEIISLISTADERTISKGMNPGAQDSFAVTQKALPLKEPITVNAYKVEKYTDQNGRERLRKTDVKKPVTIPFFANYIPVKSVKHPFAYILTVADPQVINLLTAHGIKVEKLSQSFTLEAESYKITELKPSPRSNQGHYMNQVKGEFYNETKEFEKGNILIRTAQPLGNLVSYLFEPESDDGLLIWNFFDRWIVPQWGGGFLPYPVHKIINASEINSSGNL
jgi:hypothetical protein